ncbi:para-nitrobenzyl esterase [Pyricularia oryzae 70-15]|uniref:Para-nitrobenzyl esterase n=3 Tax=Pyricularia oryzae TaxID=318829 RepID=G4NIL3_PYRO7|nr:para-nitrobenzyl esterase [Pyricularia oryzae 70-15]EHA48073.1 para-nitrobenzyl esterase [Pyricularia oryzae 70-15]
MKAPFDGNVVDASKFRPICLPRSASDFTMQPNKRFTVSEDCLFVNIFAPSNATATSNLPVMYFIQGGGFQSLSNANFNGGDLAAFGNIVVVQVNYRVGPFGFLHSKEVQKEANTNVGLKDMIMGMEWTKQNIAQFGGNPAQIVMAGDSAGATAVALLLSGWASQNPQTTLVKGAIMESLSLATLRTIDQGQEQYACLLNKTSCTSSPDTLACLRSVNASQLQTEECQFNPNLDGDLVPASMLTRFDQGLYLRVPNIAGSCSDEGTKNVPKDTNTTAEAFKFFQDQASGVLSNASLDLLQKTYLDKTMPLKDVPPNRAVDAKAPAGKLWQQLSLAQGDFRAHCVTARLQNAMARDGVKTFNYRFAPVDDEQERLGFGAYHTVELNAVFGPNNTDGDPPKSYRTSGANAIIVPQTMAYWASFVRTLDPSPMRAADTPEWKPWTGTQGRERLRFKTGDVNMERMEDDQRNNCEMLDPMLPAIEMPQPKEVVVELNRPGTSFGSSWGTSENSAAVAVAAPDRGAKKLQASSTPSSGGTRSTGSVRWSVLLLTLAPLAPMLL